MPYAAPSHTNTHSDCVEKKLYLLRLFDSNVCFAINICDVICRKSSVIISESNVHDDWFGKKTAELFEFSVRLLQKRHKVCCQISATIRTICAYVFMFSNCQVGIRYQLFCFESHSVMLLFSVQIAASSFYSSIFLCSVKLNACSPSNREFRYQSLLIINHRFLSHKLIWNNQQSLFTIPPVNTVQNLSTFGSDVSRMNDFDFSVPLNYEQFSLMASNVWSSNCYIGYSLLH